MLEEFYHTCDKDGWFWSSMKEQNKVMARLMDKRKACEKGENGGREYFAWPVMAWLRGEDRYEMPVEGKARVDGASIRMVHAPSYAAGLVLNKQAG